MALGSKRSFVNPDRRLLNTRYGNVICAVPGDHTVPVEIERAPDSGGSPGTYVQIFSGIMPKSGGYFVDLLPNDNAARWYRGRHGTGENYGSAGSYFTAFSATPRLLREDVMYSQAIATAPFSRVDDIGTDAVTTPKIYSEAVTPSESLSRYRARVVRTAVQSISDTTETSVLWTKEHADQGGLHDNSSNTARITVPSGGNTGFWIVRTQISFDVNTTGYRVVTLNHSTSGGTITTLSRVLVPAVNMTIGGFGQDTVVQAEAMYNAPTAGDYFYVTVYQNSGGALNVNADLNLSGAVQAEQGSWFEAINIW